MTKEKMHKIVSIVGGVAVIVGLYVVLGFMLLPKGEFIRQQSEQWKKVSAPPPDPTVFPTVRGKETPGLNLEEAFESTPQALAQGKKLFDVNCVACHGAQGKGDGPAAIALTPRPRNFASPKGWTQGYTLAGIFRTLSRGVPNTGMGAFDTLSASDRFDLAHYVQSLGKFDHGKDTPAQIAALDKEFHLSEGVHEPNKVAVPIIMRHMAEEYRMPAVLPMPSPGDASEGARLVRRLVLNPGRAARILTQVPDWQTNLDDLVRASLADPPHNGLDPAVAELDGRQWKLFQETLAGLAGPSGAPPPSQAPKQGA